MRRKLTQLSLISLALLSLTSCATPPPPDASACGWLRPVHLQPEETAAITTDHLRELVAQNRKIKEFCP